MYSQSSCTKQNHVSIFFLLVNFKFARAARISKNKTHVCAYVLSSCVCIYSYTHTTINYSYTYIYLHLNFFFLILIHSFSSFLHEPSTNEFQI